MLRWGRLSLIHYWCFEISMQFVDSAQTDDIIQFAGKAKCQVMVH